MKITPVYPPNVGWLEVKLDDFQIKHLHKCIDQYIRDHKENLAGNINNSQLIPDIDDWFYNNVLVNCCIEYSNKFHNLGRKQPNNQDHPYFLDTMWVNYQKETEFNPTHFHSGIYSFVIWIKIPTDYEEQKKLDIARSTSTAISNFSFYYTNILGEGVTFTYPMSPKMEGTMVFFPSKLYHQVFPFYNCKDDRISISGNILIDTRRVVNDEKI
tara:strand:+ start:138 stop:776 length:639 start_codon:yes stop_codon:yes gene_type:complete